MKRVAEMPKQTRGRPQIIPYAEILDGNARLLEPGLDYPLGTERKVAHRTYVYAKRHRIAVMVLVRADGIFVQANKSPNTPETK